MSRDFRIEDDVARVLGVGGSDLAELQRIAESGDLNAANNAIDDLKAKVKVAFRSFARRGHPDVGGDEDLFKRVSAAVDVLSQIRVVAVQRQAPQWVVFRHSNFGGWGSNTTTASTGSGWFWGGSW